MNETKKLEKIHAYVLKERKRRKIVPQKNPPDEPSCEMHGEFYNLVEVQLMWTKEGYGAWHQLNFPEILDGAYKYVIFGKHG